VEKEVHCEIMVFDKTDLKGRRYNLDCFKKYKFPERLVVTMNFGYELKDMVGYVTHLTVYMSKLIGCFTLFNKEECGVDIPITMNLIKLMYMCPGLIIHKEVNNIRRNVVLEAELVTLGLCNTHADKNINKIGG